MRVLLASALVLALAVPAAAQGCVPGEADPEWCIYANVGIPLPCIRDLHQIVTHYIDNDRCQPECVFSIWIYQETNGIEWLQRDDRYVDNTCGGQIDADQVVF